MSNLPCDECKGQCCTFPGMTKSEFKKIKRVHGLPKGATKSVSGNIITLFMPNGNCPYLVDGKCSVYALRPKGCKDYGIVPELPCRYLYPEEAREVGLKFMMGRI